MYVILVNKDNTLIATKKDRIMQRSKLVDTLIFLVPPDYNENNMANYTVLLEYVLPISRKYRTEILNKSDNTYNGHLVYSLPVDTVLTSEHGEIEMHLSFIFAELDVNGVATQRVRKTDSIKITVVPISAWSDIIPDSALSALDQRIIKTDAQIRALAELESILAATKADDLVYDEDRNELQLSANGINIGSRVKLNCDETSLEDGVPVVDFGNSSSNDKLETPDGDDNVIEF